MRGKFRWSVARLSAYLQCPYAYYLRYREKVKTSKPWYLIFGGAIHKAIEICHKGNSRQQFEPTLERPLFFKSAQAFGGFWLGLWERTVAAAEAGTGVQWTSPDQKDQLKGLGWALLAGTKDGRYKGYYHCILHPPLPIEVLEVEFTFEVDLWGYPFTGKIDQIWRTPQGTAVVDLTTGRSQAVKFLQITAYDACLRELCRTDPEARERFGAGANQHFIWTLREEKLVPTAPQDSETLRRNLEFVAAGIQDGDFRETQQDQVCRFCVYRRICGKTVGEPIPAADGETAGIKIVLPSRPPKPSAQQLTFKVGAKGGWFRGEQVRGREEA